jgi:chromate reductase, NAD(P)H dehydrogenase (quinone)
LAKFKSETTLLIQGVKGKFDAEYNLIDTKTSEELKEFEKLVKQ